MKTSFLVLFFLQSLVIFAQKTAPADKVPVFTFSAKDFKTEGGKILPVALMVYGTYGHLNAAHSNAVLLPSHFMADHHGYEWLIGPGQALDTSKLFLITTELFGNGHSSSPSNTPEPYHGPRFPVMNIRDNIDIVHRMLTEKLKITHLRAIIGFSMGAQQAFQWAVSYPTFADRIVATAGTAKTYGHGIVRLEGQIAALQADAAFKNGDYTVQPVKGIEAFSVVWTAWLYSQEWWRKELWRSPASPELTFEKVLNEYKTNFIPGADANDLILQMHTWEQQNVGNTPGYQGNVELALKSISVPFLYMPSETDMYFPINDAIYEQAFIPKVNFKPIHSLWGHTAGAASNPADSAFLNNTIGKFLSL